MTAEDIAERYSHLSGYRFINYYQVALPLWIITFDATVVAQKKIPLIEEFILLSINSGLGSLQEVSGFLGLNEIYVKKILGKLVSEDAIHSASKKLSLTQRGVALIDQTNEIQPRRTKLSILYDGISRKPIVSTSNWNPLTSQQVKQWGLFEIPPLPGKTPTETELDNVDFNVAVPRSVKQEEHIHQVISATKVGHMMKRYREAVMLVYRGVSDEDLVVKFASSDGRLIDAVEKAFAERNGVKRLNLEAQLKKSSQEAIGEFEKDPFHDKIRELFSQAEGPDRDRLLQREKVEAEIDESIVKIEEATDDESVEKLKERIEQLTSERDCIKEKYDSFSTRYLEPFEHPRVFNEALETTKRRLLIISPWINDYVMDDFKINKIEKLLRNKVCVYIGYGITKRPGDQDDDWKGRNAIDSLTKLSQRHENLVFLKLGDTHAKVLIFDCISVVGSFNWMSFGGDDLVCGGQRKVREEISIKSVDTNMVDELFNRYVSRFEHYITPQ